MPGPRVYFVKTSGGGGSAQWSSGSGAPGAGLGSVGSWYLDNSNQNVYEKVSSTHWVNRGNLNAPPVSTYAFFTGGRSYISPYPDTTDIQFYNMATDTTPATVGSSLSTARSNLGAFGSASDGYSFGGVVGGFTYYLGWDKTNFTTFTTTAIAVALANYFYGNTGQTANSGTIGYIAGENSGQIINEKFDFSSDTLSALGNALIATELLPFKAGRAMCINDVGAGYTKAYFSSYKTVGSTTTLFLQKLNFASDSSAITNAASMSGSGTSGQVLNVNTGPVLYKGYFCMTGIAGQPINSLDFTTDTITTGVNTLPFTPYLDDIYTTVNSADKGYFYSGAADIWALDFASDTTPLVNKTTLSTLYQSMSACQATYL